MLDASAYGMLRPRSGVSAEPMTVSPETALLFLTLAEPGPLPAYARSAMGDAAAETVARLVLDGVLEYRHDGRWVSAGAAAELLGTRTPQAGRGRIGELSVAAVRYGQELTDLPEDRLASRLYAYGRRPVSPELRRRMPDRAAVASNLGLAPGGAARRTLETAWRELPPRPGTPVYWSHWRPRRPAGDHRARAANYKLYLSPSMAALPSVLAVAADVLRSTTAATAFKIGCDLPGLCRPDKIVIYFDHLDDLRAAADRLSDRLGGQAAHGVPFTAAVTDDGMVSWGADPPDGGSWRWWVARRLAEFMTSARDSGEPWRFALERLRVSGIDTDTWVPAGGMWARAASG